MRISREILLLAGSLFVIAAVYNHYIGGHSAYLLEIIFLGIGASLALLSLWPQDKNTEQPEHEGLLVRFLTRFLSKEQCLILIPLAGFVLIMAWSAWKLFVVGDADLHMEDLIVTLFGLSLVLYNAGPSRFAVQKDFVQRHGLKSRSHVQRIEKQLGTKGIVTEGEILDPMFLIWLRDMAQL